MSKTKLETSAPERIGRKAVAQPQEQAPKLQRASLAATQSQAALSPPNGAPPAARTADLMMAPERGPDTVGRARIVGHMQRSVGNARLSRILGAPVQAKLTVGAPGDSYEQEAERTADTVMRMARPGVSAGRAGLAGSPPAISRVANTTGAPQVTPEVESHISASRGGGEPLPEQARATLEPRFGADFGGVRVHRDAPAQRAARALDAQAFTTGQDIYFGAGRYQPGTGAGDRLLAHELTHVVQQGSLQRRVQRLIRSPYPWRGIIVPAIGAHIRSAPDLSDPSNIVDSIPRGQTLRVLGASGSWLRVESTYRGAPLVGYIYHTLVDDAASAAMSASVGTKMVWRPSGPGSGTTFEGWASSPTETPFPAVSAATVMNCWEAVLLAAYRSGAISWKKIHKLYVSTPTGDWVNRLTRGARHTYAVPGPNLAMPQRGDIVFFNGLAHVALATGSGSNVYTFWPPPDTPFTLGGTPDRVKEFTIEDLAAWWPSSGRAMPTIEFAAPAW